MREAQSVVRATGGPRSSGAPSGTVPARAAATRSRPRAASAGADDEEGAARNEVHLVGRVCAPAQERELPSGDLLAVLRVVVDRPPPRRPAPPGVRLPTVDTLVCVAWPARLRRTLSGFGAGDVVEVSGSLRQRYWRAGTALASRTEVELASARRLARAPG